MNASQFPDKILTATRHRVMRPPTRHVYSFGDFVMDPAERSLLHKGRPISLTPKVYEALLLLLENAGHVVEKDEFVRRLWPETFVGDDTLAQNISLLRKAIADGTDGAGLIVTVPRVGYRFAGSVQKQNVPSGPVQGVEIVEPPKAGTENTLAAPQRKSARLRVHPVVLIAAALATAAVASVLTYLFLAPRAAPRVTRTVQQTFSGKVDPWGKLVTDGTRLYFLEREGDHWNLAQISLAGGETQVVAAPFRNTLLLGLSPDRGEFLVASFVQRGAEMPLWTWPVQGGPASRIGDLTAYDAAWHPNGRQIVYAKDQGIFIADRDGSHSRLFVSTRGQSSHFAWSPDGRALRFAISPSNAQSNSLWEVHEDGSNLHQLLPHWSNPPIECCGSWSQEGRYFVFGAQHEGSIGLWAIREPGGSYGTRQEQPLPLTAGQPNFEAPLLAGSDGHSLYAIALTYSAEVVSYSEKSHQFTPILPDKHAGFATYSNDGEWLAYITPPDGMLWRAKRDGSLRITLTPRSLPAAWAVWSPDARQVAFVHRSPACENKVFLVSAEGGTPRDLFPNECQQLDPAWSPDGKRLTFVRAEALPSGATAPGRIEVLNLADNQRTAIPGSEKMRGPSWSPDGRFLAAVTEDLHHLMLYDVQTQRWTKLSDGTLLNGSLSWSRNGAFLYFQDLLAPHEPVYRIRRSDHKREEVVNFESQIRAGVPRCGLIGLGPDGSVLASLLKNQGDIYKLDVSLP